MVRLSPVAMIRSVGRNSATAPAAIVLPSPQSTWPRTPLARNGPNWYCARRSIAGPAMMFSETACSMNRFGAMIGTLPLESVASSSTPRAPPQWSVWVWLKITAETGRLPRCWK